MAFEDVLPEDVEAIFLKGLFFQGFAVGLVLALLRAHDALRRNVPLGHRAWAPVILSSAGAFAMYACTPENDSGRVVLGATVATGLVALLLRQRWLGTSVALTAALSYLAIVEGAPRDSAVVGGLGIAVIHAVAQAHLHRSSRQWVVLGPLAALAVCSRVTGMRSDLPTATWESIAVVVAAAVVLGIDLVTTRDAHLVR